MPLKGRGPLRRRALALSAALALGSVTLRAASLPQRSDEERTRLADVVVEGCVVDVSASCDGRGVIWTTYELAVDRWIQPTAGPSSFTFRQPGGDVGGRHLVVSGMPQLARGDAVRLWTRDFGAGWQSLVDGAAGVVRLRDSIDPSWLDVGSLRGAAAEYSHGGNALPFFDGRPRWTAPAITFRFNDRTSDALPNVVDGVDPRAPVVAALATWRSVFSHRLEVGPDVALTDGGIDDGVNLVTFADTPGNRALVGTFWALTFWWRDGENRIYDADVMFNPDVTFTTRRTDAGLKLLQPLVTHELGHALGLTHSAVAGATMWPWLADAGSVTEDEECSQTLSFDDVAGIRQVDPDAAFDAATGSITGSVSLDGGIAYGAHVVAQRASDGIAWAGALSWGDNAGARGGTYEIRGLPPGDYLVFAEPLDGPVDDGSWGGNYASGAWWGGNFDTSFTATWHGGFASPAPVTVSAGAATTVDLVLDTNLSDSNPRFVAFSPDGLGFADSGSWPLRAVPGTTRWMAIVGRGIDVVPDSGFLCSDPAITVEPPALRGCVAGGRPCAVVRVTIPLGIRGGPRSFELLTATERNPFTGIIDVLEESDCGNGVDDDFDGDVDCGDLDCTEPAIPDHDGDGIGDRCDPDRDGDGRLDVDDCSPSDPTRWQAPVEVDGLLVAGGVTWTEQAGLGASGGYDVLRGRLSELRSDRGFARAACHVARVAAPPVALDPGPLPLGDGDWYLVRAVNDCEVGGHGTWGSSSGPNARAPLDAAPTVPCP